MRQAHQVERVVDRVDVAKGVDGGSFTADLVPTDGPTFHLEV
jgi:hypothetical protein